MTTTTHLERLQQLKYYDNVLNNFLIEELNIITLPRWSEFITILHATQLQQHWRAFMYYIQRPCAIANLLQQSKINDNIILLYYGYCKSIIHKLRTIDNRLRKTITINSMLNYIKLY